MNTTLKERIAAETEASLPGDEVMTNGLRENTHSLCGTCRHAEGCVLKGSGGTPIYECNEFESARSMEFASEPSDEASDGGGGRAQAADSAKGLCVNCESRDTCMFADMVYGVWHCEEYK